MNKVFIYDSCVGDETSSNRFYIGAQYDKNIQNYKWFSDGASLTYDDWERGLESSTHSEFYITLWGSWSKYPFGWADTECNLQKRFICEKI